MRITVRPWTNDFHVVQLFVNLCRHGLTVDDGLIGIIVGKKDIKGESIRPCVLAPDDTCELPKRSVLDHPTCSVCTSNNSIAEVALMR